MSKRASLRRESESASKYVSEAGRRLGEGERNRQKGVAAAAAGAAAPWTLLLLLPSSS